MYKADREIDIKNTLLRLKRNVEDGKREKPKKLKLTLKNKNEIEKIEDIREIENLQERIDSKLWYTGKLTEKEYLMSEALNSRMTDLLFELRMKQFKEMQENNKK